MYHTPHKEQPDKGESGKRNSEALTQSQSLLPVWPGPSAPINYKCRRDNVEALHMQDFYSSSFENKNSLKMPSLVLFDGF